jgi:hypothetical protein
VPVEGLVSKAYADDLRATLRTDAVTEVAPGRPPGAPEGEHTTHFSIVDAAGNAVSCTTTINSSFGSGLVVEGAGFLLNNEMDDFAAKPGSPNVYGLVQGEANAIAPGKRMLSAMTPTIVVDASGAPLLVTGARGGPRRTRRRHRERSHHALLRRRRQGQRRRAHDDDQRAVRLGRHRDRRRLPAERRDGRLRGEARHAERLRARAG